MWGFHIGLGFATRLTFGGYWMLVAVVVALGEPLSGAAIMVAYWLGRTLPNWAAPWLLGDLSLEDCRTAIFASWKSYRRSVAFALLLYVIVATLMAIEGQG